MKRRDFLHALLAGAMLASGRVGFAQTTLEAEALDPEDFISILVADRMRELQEAVYRAHAARINVLSSVLLVEEDGMRFVEPGELYA